MTTTNGSAPGLGGRGAAGIDDQDSTATAPLVPNREEAERFIAALAGSADAKVVFQTFADDKSVPSIMPPFWRHGTLAECWDALVRANAAGHGVFIQVNAGEARGNEHVTEPRALFVDDDKGTLDVAGLGLGPSILVRSKAGLHAYWRLELHEPLEQFEPAQAALAKVLGTDPKVKDPSRVMRVPGFFHQKDRADPFLVRLEFVEPTAYYLIDEVLEANGATLEPAASSTSSPSAPTSRADALELGRKYLMRVPPAVQGQHGDDTTYRIAAHLRRELALSEDDALELMKPWNAACAPPWPEAKLREIIRHAHKYGTADLGSALPVRPKVVRISLEAIHHPPRETFVLGNLFPLAKSSLLFGPSGLGKSALLSQIAFALAAGADYLWDLPLIPGGAPVLVYSAEDSEEDWVRKAAALRLDGKIDVERALERFHLIDKTEGIARLSEVVKLHEGSAGVSTTRHVPRASPDQEFIIDAAREVGAKLIIIETASRLVDEEDNAHFSALQSACGRIARETGGGVILTHHSTKAASRENEPSIEAARGGGALVNNARNVVALFPALEDEAKKLGGRFEEDEIFTLHHLKGTSSTRKQAPLTLVRIDRTFGGVFHLPSDVAYTPEQEAQRIVRAEEERKREVVVLGALRAKVKELTVTGQVSPARLRTAAAGLGIEKRELDATIAKAVEAGFLVSGPFRGGRGVALTPGPAGEVEP